MVFPFHVIPCFHHPNKPTKRNMLRSDMFMPPVRPQCFSRSLSHYLTRSLARANAQVSTVRARALSPTQQPPTNLLACMRESPGICHGPSIPFPWVKESGKTSNGWIEAVAFIPRSVSVKHASTFLFEPAWMNPCTAPVNSACISLVDGLNLHG
jgi:hypothetical protein